MPPLVIRWISVKIVEINVSWVSPTKSYFRIRRIEDLKVDWFVTSHSEQEIDV